MIKNQFRIFGSIAIVLLLHGQDLRAQFGTISISAGASYFQPLGALNGRFLSTVGGSFHVADLSGSDPTWGMLVEYGSFQRENRDKLFLTRKYSYGGKESELRSPLTALQMELSITGLSATMDYSLYRIGFLEHQAGLAFGLYRWEFSREAYSDTLKAITTTGPLVVDIPKVPPSKQLDWSGGVGLGTNLVLHLASPLSVTIGVKYKIIIGELWPALSLDMENVSTLQMLDLRIGVRADF
ncbi:MAG: hypothetical protein V1799_04995 [bacterium]